MDILTELFANATAPWLSALILGLMTAISPCPLATNITAVGFISKDIGNKHRVFLNGLFYTLGRTIAYTGLAFILYLGADQLKLSGLFQSYGQKLIGPLLVLIGLLMLDVLKLKFPGLGKLTAKMDDKKSWGFRDTLLLGMLFALAFCPYSGVLYFGMLIPMTISSGMHLPVIFALATGLPVIIFAWVFAYAVSGLGNLYNKVKTFELWFRRGVAVLFIGVGIYYILSQVL
jgi:sulfite exporter TauE/SafE